MDNVDPALDKYWNAQTPKNGTQKATHQKRGRTVPVPLTAHPSIRHAALQRYLNDEADLQLAGSRVKQAPQPWDLRALHWAGKWSFRRYVLTRGFLIAHIGRVTAQEREYRLTACEGCTFRKDRSDGLMICPPMLAKCGCGPWLLACLWHVTKLRKTKCPADKWKLPETAGTCRKQPAPAADKPAVGTGCKSTACPSKPAESPAPQ